MHFLDDEDNEVMQKELKEAFRLYDKDGERRRTQYQFNYISTLSVVSFYVIRFIYTYACHISLVL